MCLQGDNTHGYKNLNLHKNLYPWWGYVSVTGMGMGMARDIHRYTCDRPYGPVSKGQRDCQEEDSKMEEILVDSLSKDYKVTWVHFIYCEAYQRNL